MIKNDLFRKMLEPAVWLSGRLVFSRKFILIGMVVMLGMLVLSQPILRRSSETVRVSMTERAGLELLSTQIDLLTAAVAERERTLKKHRLSGEDRGQVASGQAQETLKRLGDLAEKIKPLGLEDQSRRLERNLAVMATLDENSDVVHHFSAWTGVSGTLLDIMRESARAQRLSVDAELDAAFEMLVVRLPLVLETLARQRDVLLMQNPDLANYALGAQVTLTESAAGLKTGMQQLSSVSALYGIARSGSASTLNVKLEELLAQISLQQDAADTVMGAPDDNSKLQELAAKNLGLTSTILKLSIETADDLLQARIDDLQEELWIVALQILAALLAVAYLFMGIYSSIQRSIRALADGTKEFCAGKLETRVAIDTKDELVFVASNFNTVASEFSRLLDVIRDQNESRQRELERLVQERTLELNRKNEELRENGARVEEELALARGMQLAILPQYFPDAPEWSAYACMFPAREMGGDFYDCVQLPDGRYGLLVADVSGKGVAAAFFMAVSRTVILDLALAGESPAHVMAKANDLLCDRNPMELFVTVFYAIFDPVTQVLTYASAGHNPPVLRSATGDVRAIPCPMDTALGVMPGLDYSDSRLCLRSGEAVVMYTDGVTEAFNGEGEAYGEERLAAWARRLDIREGAQNLVSSLVDDVAAFVAGAEASDDLTCLILTCKTEGVLLDLVMPTRLSEIAVLAGEVDRVLSDRPDLAFSVNLCLEELITNTILHGLGGEESHEIYVRMVRKDNWLEITIIDDATPYDPFVEAPPPDLEADVEDRPIGGLGVYMVKTMMTEVSAHHDCHGNRVILRKRLEGEAGGEDLAS